MVKKTTIYTGGKKIEGLRFQGELMKCHHCGKEQFSNPAKESGWTGIEIPPRDFYYFCTDCWPSANLSKKAYAEKAAALLRGLLG